VTGVRADVIVQGFPQLFHMAEPGSWPSIQRHGLLSTSALLDLFEVTGARREALEARHRPESIRLQHPRHGVAVVRDQKPMSDRGLLKCLPKELTPSDWYRFLNARVFFWLDFRRLDRLLGARAYRDQRHTVLTVDTAQLLARHEKQILLSPINSGSTIMNPAPRGQDTFLPLERYPFEAFRKKRGLRNAIVELTVTHSVPGIRGLVLRVEERGGGRPPEVLFERET
jgi:hypothetical protein